LLNSTISKRGYIRTVDIAYGPLPRQKLDVYVPRHVAAHADIVIFFYGGHWQSGSKYDYRFVAEAITSRGFIAVLPNYRLYPEVTFPGFVEDGALAVRWVHDHASSIGGDPENVFLMGHSAGAHIVALLTLDAHYLKDVGLDRNTIAATAGLSGPYQFVPSSGDRQALGMVQGQTTPDPKIEPINFVDGREPAMLIVVGSVDKTVSPDDSAALAARIKQRGGDVNYILYQDVAHVGVVLALADNFRWIAPVLRDTAQFFHDHERHSLSSPR
jgi:acetyl esterase/lipase